MEEVRRGKVEGEVYGFVSWHAYVAANGKSRQDYQ